MRSRAARRDNNDAEVAKHLRSHGVELVALNAPGVPDYAWAFNATSGFLEVKKAAAKGDKAPAMQLAQVRLHARWERAGVLIPVVQSSEEALAAIRWLSTREEDWREPGDVQPHSYRDFRWLDANERVVPEERRAQLLAELLLVGG